MLRICHPRGDRNGQPTCWVQIRHTLHDRRYGQVRLASRVEAPCSHHQYPNLEGLDHQTPRSEPHCFLKYDQKIQIRVSENLVIKYIRREALRDLCCRNHTSDDHQFTIGMTTITFQLEYNVFTRLFPAFLFQNLPLRFTLMPSSCRYCA
jgi:hypothetical protein